MHWRAYVCTREKVRPARSNGGCECDKVRPACEKWPKFSVFALAGRSFSRKCRWRGGAGGSFSRQPVLCSGLVAMRRTWGWLRWGVCAMRSPLAACRRRVGALDGVIPPIGGDELAAWVGAVPATQTTSVKNAENGVLWARWSVFWAQRHLVWSVARMWAPEYAGCPLDSHVNPLYRT